MGLHEALQRSEERLSWPSPEASGALLTAPASHRERPAPTPPRLLQAASAWSNCIFPYMQNKQQQAHMGDMQGPSELGSSSQRSGADHQSRYLEMGNDTKVEFLII